MNWKTRILYISAAILFHACEKDTPIVPESELPDMCQRIKILENNNTFVETLNTLLIDSRKKDYEVGYLVYPSESNVFRYEHVQGEPSAASITFAPIGQVEGLIHTHYRDLFPTFSATDVKAIYDTYNQEHMHNFTTFFCSVVSSEGNAYLLKIQDMDRFILFSGRYFLHEQGFRVFETSYYEKQQDYLKEFGNIGSYERALIDLLKESGLVLFKAREPFRIWNRLEIGDNRDLIEVGCDLP